MTEEQRQAMKEAHAKGVFLTVKELRPHVTAIRQTIKNEEIRIRAKYSWLQYQDTIGLLALVVPLLVIATTMYLYVAGSIHWALTVPLIAMSVSIIHELEHDLIHNMYFRRNPQFKDTVYYIIWCCKMLNSPWKRAVNHLRHHVVSGQRTDTEERSLGIGLSFLSVRTAVLFFPLLITLTINMCRKHAPLPDNVLRKFYYAVIPYSIMQFMAANALRLHMGWTFGAFDPVFMLPQWIWTFSSYVGVLVILPHMLRQCSINFITTSCHYYGDIPNQNVFYQNQVLDHWIFLPLHLFCFNFGATHIIHHFVPSQPFYIRQMISRRVIREMEQRGIRRNDLGVWRRKNRYFELDEEAEEKRYQETKMLDEKDMLSQQQEEEMEYEKEVGSFVPHNGQ